MEPDRPGGCAHRWLVEAEQRWRWRVLTRCRRCGEVGQVEPGRWWRRRDAARAVEGLLQRLDGPA